MRAKVVPSVPPRLLAPKAVFRLRTPPLRPFAALSLSAAIASGLWACGTAASTDISVPEPDLFVRVYETFYDVEGATVAAVDSSLRSRRPERAHGVAVAEIDWDARLDYRTRDGLAGCRLERVRLELVFTVILPRLATNVDTRSKLASQWERFLAAIKFHEEGHREITVREALELMEELEELRASSCSELRRQAAAASDRFVGRARNLNETYDLRTNYGRRDGVRWPPSPD